MKISDLRQKCQPSYKQATDPLMEWYVLRPFSIYFTWLFVKLGFSANFVSFLGFVFAFIGGALFLQYDVGFGLVGAVFIWFGFLFDCVDGEVSRWRGQSSVPGIYLDYFIGGVNDMIIMVCLGFYVSHISGWSLETVLIFSVLLAYIEKIIGLYSQSVIFRNVRSYWAQVSDQEVRPEESAWKKLTILQRLVRVPFETFFRASLILAAFFFDYLFGSTFFVVFVWCVLSLLGWILVFKSFYSEFFHKRVEISMKSFIVELKNMDKQ